MRRISRQEKVDYVLTTCFNEFAEKGLENTTMRNLAAACDFALPSLYDYGISKTNIVIDSVSHYMKMLQKKFEESFKYQKPTLKEEAKSIFSILTGEKKNLNFVYQVLSSPKFGGGG